MKNSFSSRITVLSALLVIILAASCDETKKTGGNAVISGKLTNSSGDTLYLMDVSTQNFEIIDSVVTEADGSFELRPLLTYKGFYNLEVGKTGQQFATLILEPNDSIGLTGDAKNLGYSWKTTGSKDAARFEELNTYITALERKRGPLTGRLDSLQRAFQVQVSMIPTNDTAKVAELDKVFGKIYEDTQAELFAAETEGADFVRAFIDRDSASFANIPALRLLEPFDNLAYYDKTLNALEVKYKGSPNVKMLRDFVERERPHCKGQIPPEIALADPNGKVMKLSSMKGKVVLLDFWASWCGPCIAELPTVVSNYKKYNAQGFEVFSVSLDRDKNAWTNSIQKHNLTWPYHVSDLMEWQSSVVPLYRIKGIPKTLLLDREGRIIDRELRGEALSKKLDEIFADKGAEPGGKID